YTHILVPTDFSPAAHRALGYALEEATLHRAKLTLLHVLQHHSTTEVYYVKDAPQSSTSYVGEFGEKLPSFPTYPPQTVRYDYNEGGLEHLPDLVPASFTGAWDVQVTAGDPADGIVRLAEELAVDLIVMATHGRTSLPHFLLGSVAEKVIRHAPCPVLTIR